MKICCCRIVLPVAIALIALIWWPAGWARILIVIAAGLLAVAGLLPTVCCCCMKKDKPVEVEGASAPD